MLIYGAEGAGKSYLACFFALLRMIYLDMEVEINDPHLQLNGQKWDSLLRCGVQGYGAKDNYKAIASRLKEFYKRMGEATPEKKWHCPIFDELDEYSQEDEIKEVSLQLMRKCVSRPWKAHEAPILIAHGKTLELLGGGNSVRQAIDDGIIIIHLMATRNNFGDKVPLYRGTITGLPDANGNFNEQKISINPDWMNGEFLLSLFPEMIASKELPSEANKNTLLSSPELTTADAILGSKNPQLLAIWKYSKGLRRPIKAAEVQQNVREFQPKGEPRTPTSEIRELFLLLECLGYGKCEGENSKLIFYPGE